MHTYTSIKLPLDQIPDDTRLLPTSRRMQQRSEPYRCDSTNNALKTYQFLGNTSVGSWAPKGADTSELDAVSSGEGEGVTELLMHARVCGPSPARMLLVESEFQVSSCSQYV